MGFTNPTISWALYFSNGSHNATRHNVPRKVQISAITPIKYMSSTYDWNQDDSNATSEKNIKYIFKTSVVFYWALHIKFKDLTQHVILATSNFLNNQILSTFLRCLKTNKLQQNCSVSTTTKFITHSVKVKSLV